MIWKTTNSEMFHHKPVTYKRKGGLLYDITSRNILSFVCFLGLLLTSFNSKGQEASVIEGDDCITFDSCPVDQSVCADAIEDGVSGAYINWERPLISQTCVGDGSTGNFQMLFELNETLLGRDCWDFNYVQRVGTDGGYVKLFSSNDAAGTKESTITTPYLILDDNAETSIQVKYDNGTYFVSLILIDENDVEIPSGGPIQVTASQDTYTFNTNNLNDETGIYRLKYVFNYIGGKPSNANTGDTVIAVDGILNENDNCAAGVDFTVTGPTTGFYPVGSHDLQYVATYTAPDGTIKRKTCSFNITIGDTPAAPTPTTNPIVECAAESIQTLDANDAFANSSDLVWYDAASGGNAVASPTINSVGTATYYAERVSGTCPSNGRTAITLTINPTPAAPVVNSTTNTTCGLDNGAINFQTVSGLTYTLTDEFNNSYSHNSGVYSNLTAGNYSLTASNPDCDSEVTPVTITATDDTTNPTLSISGNISENSDSGSCSANINIPDVSFSDNCSGATLSWTMNGAVTANGNGQIGSYTFNVGETTIQYTVSDASSNSISNSLTVTVTDNEIPVIASVSAINENAHANSCGALLNIVAPTATDNCSIGAVTGTRDDGAALNELFPVGTTTITWNVDDVNGNSATPVVQTVKITDTQLPVITCPGGITENTADGENFAVVNYNEPSFSDNCDVSITRIAGPASGSNFPKGVTTITYEAEDASGNKATCSFTVTVNDSENPTINCPASITQGVDVDNCSAVVTYELPTADDNSGNVTMSRISGPASGSTFPVGVTPITYRATDEDNNFVECTFTVTVLDDQLPTIDSKDKITVNNDPGICGAVVMFSTPAADDNCPSLTIERTAGPSSGSVFQVGTTTVTFRATDGAGNTVSTSFEVEVIDNEDPVITQYSNIISSNDTDACGAIVTFDAPTVNDNCGISSLTQTQGLSSGSEFPIGTTPVSFTAIDIYGNSSTMTFDVIVSDDQDPVISCPNTININTEDGEEYAVVNYNNATATDNCSVTVQKISGPDSGSQFPIGTTTITFEATDASGNTAECSFDIVVSDNEAPEIDCPDNIVQTNDIASCDAIVTFTTPTFSDNSGDVNISQTAGPASGEEFPVGTTTVSFRVTDAAGNQASCSFNVTIEDDQAPEIADMPDIIENNDNGICGAFINFNPPVVDDNCGIESLEITKGFTSGSRFPVGETTVEYTVTDVNGNIATTEFTVTIVDVENPMITCRGDLSVNASENEDFAVVTFDDPIFDDNCGADLTQTAGPASGSNFPLGTTTVTFQAQDEAGNMVECSFDVTVNDAQAPTIDCPSDISQNVDGDLCTSIVNYSIPTATDNSGDVTVTLESGLAPGSAFPKGTTTVTYRATDNEGNFVECSFDVVIGDDQDPTIDDMNDITVNNDEGICGAIVSFAGPGGDDNCTLVSIERTAGLDSGSEFPVGTTTVTFTATDDSNNTTSTSFDVIVIDNEAPGIVQAEPIMVDSDSGTCGAIVNYSTPVASDNCSVESLILTDGLASGSEFPIGTSTVTYTATDVAGNSFEMSFDVMVSDNEMPEISCPSDINVDTTDGESFAVVTFSDAAATDNCDVTVAKIEGLDSGSQFPIGTTTITYEATDASGNTTQCSFDIVVSDNEDPEIKCPDNISQSVDTDSCDALVTFDDPVYSDNSGIVTLTQTAGPASGEVFPIGHTTVSFTATDENGNSVSCSFTVTVLDDQDPEIADMDDITVDNDPDVCGAIVNFFPPAASDNCSLASLSVTEGFGPGSQFPIGTTLVTYTAIDNAGNSATSSFNVTVVDAEAPTLSCIGDLAVSAAENVDYAVVNFADPSLSDNCGATLTQTEGPVSGSQFPLGTTTITFEAIDNAGNTSTCSFSITVNDSEAPTINCPTDINQSVDTGSCDAVVNYTLPTASDNSGVVNLSLVSGPASGESFPLGTTTVTYRATDDEGNFVECSFDVTISDDQAPTIADMNDITMNNDPGVCGAVVSFDAPMASDNCEIDSVTLTAGLDSGAEFPVGTTEVTYTATDNAGNSFSSSFTVTVIDAEAPTLTCIDDVSVSAAENADYAMVIFDEPMLSDNCDATLAQTEGPASGSQFPLGTTTVTFEATDDAGNTSTCSFTVTVSDSEAPTINCPVDIDQNMDSDSCIAVVDYQLPTASDNSGNVNITLVSGPAPGESFPIGTTTVTYRATDDEGNFVECSFDVTISDDQAPTIADMNDITMNNDPGVCGAVVSFDAPMASDNCEIDSVTLTAGLDSGAEFPVGTTEVTYTATDNAGNSVSSSFTVTVIDAEAPTLTCIDDVSVSAAENADYAMVIFDEPMLSDNCDATLAQTEGPASGSQFPLGTTTVIFEATDDAGNTSTCSFTVTVSDSEAPTINCPVDIDQNMDSDSCSAVVDYQLPTASDNSGNVNITLVSGPAPGETFPIGTTTVTYRATDDEGNFVECSFDVKISDDQAPTIADMNDITMNNDPGVCGAVVSFDAPDAEDNCELDVIELTEGLQPGSEFPVGTTTVTYTATDNSGNSVTSSFDVIVIDTESPSIDCPSDITMNAEFGKESMIVNYDEIITSDNCGVSKVELSAGFASGEEFPVGETTTVSYSVTDASGNTTECSFTVTINQDNPEPPSAPTGSVSAEATCANPTGTITVDTREGLTYSVDGENYQESGVFENLDPGTYQVTARDEFGQISGVTSIIIEDPVAEQVETEDNLEVCNDSGIYDLNNVFLGEFEENGSWIDTDNSGGLDNGFIDPSIIEPGFYNFEYLVEGTCPSSTIITIEIVDCIVLDCDLEDLKDSISKAVTPNGDNRNDFFEVDLDTECGFTYNLKIFNRWGSEVFSAQNYQNNWDGYSESSFTNSNQLPSGTYYYILEIRNSEFRPIQGYIYLGTK
ncbi:HYR domain-containing protein [Gramella lutea]|uniref:HYR domain-containing protein n=1 Tax=Christiangramia lutea TaxID=1607951 RepID=A0A9X1V2P9_9FLAO|nr:HYR domain-containing protein [Christiangramia lutea]MCH4823312.1 HYR domain-containing protein [Christiangramia lutea]